MKNKRLFTIQESQEIDAKAQGLSTKKTDNFWSARAVIAQAAVGAMQIISTQENLDSCAVVLLCGSGHNACDALALSFLMLQSGFDPRKLALLLPPKFKSPGAKISTELSYWLKQNNSFVTTQFWPNLETILGNFQASAEKIILIDALLGTGFKAPLSQDLKSLFKKIERLKRKAPFKIYSMDIPSGLSAEDSEDGCPLVPDSIIEFGTRKWESHRHLKLIHSQFFDVPLTFDLKAFDKLIQYKKKIQYFECFSPHNSQVQVAHFSRSATMHKYQAGSACILGGGLGQEGAVLLAGQAFLKAGGGLARIVFEKEASRGLGLRETPSLQYSSLEAGFLNKTSLNKSPQPPAQTLILGPGWPVHLAMAEVPRLLSYLSSFSAIILDAGGLSLWSELKSLALKKPGSFMLTPHTGELKKYLGFESPQSEADFKQISQYVSKHKIFLYLKGPISFIFTPNAQIFLWKNPESRLAVAGSGDIFCGLLAAARSKILAFSKASSSDATNPVIREFAEAKNPKDFQQWMPALQLALLMQKEVAKNCPAQATAEQFLAHLQQCFETS